MSAGASGRLANEIVLVTGSTRGLGKVIAECCVAEGARVVVTGRDENLGRGIAESLGDRVRFVPAELRTSDDAEALVEQTVEAFGSLTVLVNNAVATDRMEEDTSLLDLDDEVFESVRRGCLDSVVWLSRAALRVMVPAGMGSIVNVSSRAATTATPGLASYIAAKGGMNALTRSIATDYAADGIRCNTVSPGYILNDIRDQNLTPGRRRRLEAMHLTRLATGDDVANAVVFLASPDGAVITGALLPVDGGATIARASSFG